MSCRGCHRGRPGRAVAGSATSGAVVAVVATVVTPQEILALHLAFEARDVAVAKVLAQLLDLFKLQEVDAQDLQGFDHLESRHALSHYSAPT